MNKLWAITLIAVGCLVLVVAFGTCARKQENELSRANHNSQNADSSKSKRIEGKIACISRAGLERGLPDLYTIAGTKKVFTIYTSGVENVSPYLRLVEPGDEVVIEYNDNGREENPIQHFDVLDSTKRRIFGLPLPNDATPIAGQEHLLDPSSSTAYKHSPGSLGYNVPSSLGPEFPQHKPKVTILDPTDPANP